VPSIACFKGQAGVAHQIPPFTLASTPITLLDRDVRMLLFKKAANYFSRAVVLDDVPVDIPGGRDWPAWRIK